MNARSKILIVDQEKIVGDLLASTFPADHFQVFHAASSTEAARLANLHGPDLAVIDPSIPDGFGLIDSLRSSGQTRIFVLSACRETLERARAYGIEQVIDKKEGLPRLAEALRSAGFNLLSIGQKGRVLIVDDEPDIRSIISTFLTQRGYTCLSSASGFDALELLPQDISQMV